MLEYKTICYDGSNEQEVGNRRQKMGESSKKYHDNINKDAYK